MESVLAITRALADENRVRALLALEGRELCVCQLIELLQLAPSTVSKHMSILKQARLVRGEKRGRWMYYQLADADAPAEARQALEWIHSCLSRAPMAIEDQKNLEKIVRLDRDEICRRQACR
jgi:DNA-binding transcriptional ArsR family regulator